MREKRRCWVPIGMEATVRCGVQLRCKVRCEEDGCGDKAGEVGVEVKVSGRKVEVQ